MSASRPQAVVIGASSGALEALSVILPALPRAFDLPVIIVVHIPPDKKSILADLFDEKCAIRVLEAEDKEPIRGGTAYFAPPGYHLQVEKDKSLSLSNDHPVLFSRPSVDVLFESATDAYGEALIAIVLSGANQDGANGLKAVIAAGGTGLVQHPDEAFSRAMPEAAIALCPTAKVLSLQGIALYLKRIDKV
jgi:two-component system, chemotaxis family, protein-glutamate methylesterase/glutaminase